MAELICCCVAPTAKSCEPCGTYAIPYPLSTGPNCGDPSYNKFNCTKSTGKVSFMMRGGISYPVTEIDEDNRMFFIQPDYSNSLNPSFNPQNSIDFPFSLAEYTEGVVIKINWRPAPEPPCSKPIDCLNWPHSTCRATREGEIRCHCDSNYIWNATIMRCTQGYKPLQHCSK